MAFIGDFDANTVEPVDFSPLPSGEYTVLISNSEMRSTKSGDGQYLALTFQVLEGPKQGRMLWHNLNLINNNPKAVEIAQRELSAICHAVNVMRIKDSTQLHDLPMKITVEFIPAKPDGKGGEWPEKNRIKKWTAINGASQAAPSAAPRPAPSAAAPRPVPAAAPSAAPATLPESRQS